MTEAIQQHNTTLTLKYVTNHNYGLITRDRIRLSTIIHRPDDDQPRDTLVIRTCYNAMNFFQVAKLFATNLPIKMNYIVQDVRGRYNSQGEFANTAFEQHDDTVDTLDFIAEQPWSNGDIHIFGPSYMGWVGLQALQVRNKTKANIKSVFAPVAFSDMLDNAIYQDGVLNLHHAYPWCIMMSGKVQGPLNYLNIPFPEAYDTAMELGVDAQGYPSNMWNFFLDKERLSRLKISYYEDPTFSTKATIVASYFDNLTRGTIKSFEEILKIGGKKPNLIVGPWGHNQYMTSLDSVGAIKVNIDKGLKEDFVEHLMNINGSDDDFFVRIFVLRKDEWKVYKQWPLPNRPREFVMSLSETQRRIEANYNNPVKTWGGPVWDNQLVEGLNPGPIDQREINNRDDIIKVYTQPFSENVIIMGDTTVRVGVKASLAGSHITAKLNLVDQEGVEYIMQDGIRIVNNTQDLEKQTIKLDFSSFEVKTGERLMIELSWSNFARYEKPRHKQDYVLDLDDNVTLTVHTIEN